MSRLDSDKQFFDRLRVEQITEVVEYFRLESESISEEVIDAVRNNNFTLASMKAGELDLCKRVMSRAERYLKSRKDDQ